MTVYSTDDTKASVTPYSINFTLTSGVRPTLTLSQVILVLVSLDCSINIITPTSGFSMSYNLNAA